MPKKKKGHRLTVAMGDTVRLTKGRIGLIRFIGKTQFGLGQWIGIELYNSLIMTRHNGAVLGKRYFRCPPHRGVFVRRSLIKENIAVLDIQPSINKLRAKEKKIKSQAKKNNHQARSAKKQLNAQKREAKQLKIKAKYGSKLDKKMSKRSSTPTARSSPHSPMRARSKSPNRSPTLSARSNSTDKVPVRSKSPAVMSRTKSPRRNKQSTQTPDTSLSKLSKKSPQSRESSKRKRRKPRTQSASNSHATYESSDSELDEFPSTSPSNASGRGKKKKQSAMAVAKPMVAKTVKVKYQFDGIKIKKKKKKKAKAMSTDFNIANKHRREPSAELSEEEDEEDDAIQPLERSGTVPAFGGKQKSNKSDVLARVRQESDSHSYTDELDELDKKRPKHKKTKTKTKVKTGNDDGVVDSEDSSLNDEEELSDLEKELEEDFEERGTLLQDVVEAYTHTIDDIESGRKKLAEKVVRETKRRLSQDKSDAPSPGGRTRANGLSITKEKPTTNPQTKPKQKQKQKKKKKQSKQSHLFASNFQRKKPSNFMMVATMTGGAGMGSTRARKKSSSKTFDAARSRRGSSFVDDYNLNDTLFFDGAEESQEIEENDHLDPNSMVFDENDDEGDELTDPEDEEDDESDEEDEKEQEKTRRVSDKKVDQEEQPSIGHSGSKSMGSAASESTVSHASSVSRSETTLGDEDEEDDSDDEEDEEDEDPLLGRLEDILEQESEEDVRTKGFEVEFDEFKRKDVLFYEGLDKFMQWSEVDGYVGVKLDAFCESDKGKALRDEVNMELSVWLVSQIDGKDVTVMSKQDVTEVLGKCEEFMGEKGYRVRFEMMPHGVNQKKNLRPSLVLKGKAKTIE